MARAAKGPIVTFGSRSFTKVELYEIAAKILEEETGTTYDKKGLAALEIDYAEKWRTTWQPASDLSFYAHPEYAWLTLHCWMTWSAGTIRGLGKFVDRQRFAPKSVLDFGAGIGLTTVQLASLFPSAQITYANVPCIQATVAKRLFAAVGATNIVCVDANELSQEHPAWHHDAVVAVEVMEHIKAPGAALNGIIAATTAVYVDASTFAVDMAGHFAEYEYDGVIVPRKRGRRFLNKSIRALGFEPSWHVLEGDFRMYQGVPTVYVRRDLRGSVFTLASPAVV